MARVGCRGGRATDRLRVAPARREDPAPEPTRWERPIAYVTNMFVEPERRRLGLGRELLDVATSFARDRGADGVLLWPSPRSVPFYERAGFEAGQWRWLEIAGD